MSTIRDIEKLNGAGEFKRLASEMARVFRSARSRRLELEMPAVIMLTGNGMGNTTCLRLLADLLKEERVLSFSGEEDVFEWRILSDDDAAVSRLIRRMEQAAGFYPYFSGVIGLDLTDIENPERLDHGLFELMRENSRKVLFCLMVSGKKPVSFLRQLQSRLSGCMQVRNIRLEMNIGEKCQFVRAEFRRKGFILRENLDDAVRAFAEAAGTCGYKSLEIAVNEVVWKKISDCGDMLIRPEDLDAYRQAREGKNESAPDQKRRIGFGTRGI